MGAGRRRRIESLEHVEEEESDRPVGEEDGDDGLDRLIDEMADREPLEREPEPERATGHEFTCRACHLILSRACLADETRMLCADCVAIAEAGEVPHVHHVRHPCPACGDILMVPEREEVSCGFFCPSCGVHLTRRSGHVHLVWNHRGASGGRTMKVLVAESETWLRDVLLGWLREAGFEVVGWPGPEGPDFLCAGARKEGCPLAEDADAIVLDLELESDLLICGVAPWELLHYYPVLGQAGGRADGVRGHAPPATG